MKLKQTQYNNLVEALRRFDLFHSQEDITKAWTGLGFLSEYKSSVQTGLMKLALMEFDNPNKKPTPHIMHWWSLTEKGAKIVKHWKDKGYNYSDIASNRRLPVITDLPEGLD